MEIVSISLDAQKILELEQVKKELGLKSRSKLISCAISEYIKKQKNILRLDSRATVIFMITHGHAHKTNATAAISGYESLVKTILHHHSKRGCIDLLIVEGDSKNIVQVYKKISRMGGIKSVEFSII